MKSNTCLRSIIPNPFIDNLKNVSDILIKPRLLTEINCANQLTGFYKKAALALNELSELNRINFYAYWDHKNIIIFLMISGWTEDS